MTAIADPGRGGKRRWLRWFALPAMVFAFVPVGAIAAPPPARWVDISGWSGEITVEIRGKGEKIVNDRGGRLEKSRYMDVRRSINLKFQLDAGSYVLPSSKQADMEKAMAAARRAGVPEQQLRGMTTPTEFRGWSGGNINASCPVTVNVDDKYWGRFTGAAEGGFYDEKGSLKGAGTQDIKPCGGTLKIDTKAETYRFEINLNLRQKVRHTYAVTPRTRHIESIKDRDEQIEVKLGHPPIVVTGKLPGQVGAPLAGDRTIENIPFGSTGPGYRVGPVNAAVTWRFTPR